MRKVALFALALLVLITVGDSGRSQIKSPDRIQRAVEATEVAAVRGTAHPLARPQFDQGRKDPGDVIRGSMTFRLSSAQQADLENLLREQQDTSSPNYHRWLTPDQYAARFGMSSSDLVKVSSWLQSQGLNVEEISRNHNEISFSGTTGQVEYAFKTELHNYTVKGEQHFANATDVSLPAAFSAEVLGVRGLNDFRPKPRTKPAPRFTSSISGNHFLIPGDFWKIYDVPNSTYNGAGQKIAVAGQTDIDNTDINAFQSASGLPVKNPTKILVPNTGNLVIQSQSGDEAEADLDVEWAGGIAPGATIVYVTIGSNTANFSVFDALNYAVQNNLATVISISYGNCESNMGLSDTLMFQQWAQQGNVQGQTISGPSGDSGAADCESATATSATHGYQVDVPASIPEVTGVGGTEFTGDAAATVINGCASATTYWASSCSPTSGASALSYIPEMGWNDTVPPLNPSLSAGGGGASTFFGKPSWQSGTGVPSDGRRDVPDIALNGSPSHDPYLICSAGDCVNGFRDSNNNLDAVGGTSVGAPTFAGIVALINQATLAAGKPSPQGNVNPMLYSLAAKNSQNNAFHDITSGNNIVPCSTGTTNCPSGTTSIGFSAGAGYDQVTGLGSLDVAKLISAWIAATPSPDFSLAAQNSTIAAPGSAGSSTLTITSMHGFAGTVNLTCTGVSGTAQVGCSMNPASVNLAADSTATATVNITTVAELQAPAPRRGLFAPIAASSGVFAAVIVGSISSKRRWLAVLGLSLGVALLAGVACGGGSSNNTQQKSQGTPAGTYVVTVTGTASGGSPTHSATLSVTVQ